MGLGSGGGYLLLEDRYQDPASSRRQGKGSRDAPTIAARGIPLGATGGRTVNKSDMARQGARVRCYWMSMSRVSLRRSCRVYQR